MPENANAKAKAVLVAAANIRRKDAERWAAEQKALENLVALAPPVRAAKKGGRKQRQTRRQRQSRQQRKNQ